MCDFQKMRDWRQKWMNLQFFWKKSQKNLEGQKKSPIFAPAKTEEREFDGLATIFEVMKLTMKFSKYILG